MIVWWAAAGLIMALTVIALLRPLIAPPAAVDDPKPRHRKPGPGGRLMTALLVAGLPVAALAVYFEQGRPRMPDQPFAQRAETLLDRAAQGEGDPHVVAAQLAERLLETPHDVRGWLALGRAYAAIGRHREAAGAYRRAADLEPRRPEIRAAVGAALTAAADGVVTTEAADAFNDVLALDPRHPAGRYYAGLARLQAGDPQGALAVWLPLRRTAPADAPWRPALREHLEIAADAMGRELAALSPSADGPRGIDAAPDQGARAEGTEPVEEIAARQAETEEERLGLIRGLVDGLADRLRRYPDDVEGLRRLGRAYQVLGEPDRANAAFAQAAETAPDREDVVAEYARALLEISEFEADGAPPAAFIAALRRLEAVAPQHEDVLWYLGLEAARKGDAEAARARWTQLRDGLPQDEPRRAMVEARLRALP